MNVRQRGIHLRRQLELANGVVKVLRLAVGAAKDFMPDGAVAVVPQHLLENGFGLVFFLQSQQCRRQRILHVYVPLAVPANGSATRPPACSRPLAEYALPLIAHARALPGSVMTTFSASSSALSGLLSDRIRHGQLERARHSRPRGSGTGGKARSPWAKSPVVELQDSHLVDRRCRQLVARLLDRARVTALDGCPLCLQTAWKFLIGRRSWCLR